MLDYVCTVWIWRHVNCIKLYERRFRTRNRWNYWLHTSAHLCASWVALHCATNRLRVTMICLRRGELSPHGGNGVPAACSLLSRVLQTFTLMHTLFASSTLQLNWTVDLTHNNGDEIYRDSTTRMLFSMLWVSIYFDRDYKRSRILSEFLKRNTIRSGNKWLYGIGKSISVDGLTTYWRVLLRSK